MSELRTNYPQAKAWTFLIDTPAAASGGSTSSSPTTRPSAAVGPAGRGRAAPSVGEPRRTKKNSSLCSSVSGSVNGGGRGEIMGGLCSSNKTSIVRSNKENFGDLGAGEGSSQVAGAATTVVLAPAPGDSASNSCGMGKEVTASVKTGGNDQQPSRGAQEENDLLDSTAFLSPDPEDEAAADTRGVCAALDMCLEEEQGACVGDGSDRSAWLVRNLGLLRGGGIPVDVGRLAEVAGLEDCLHELLTDRARHLKAMENLTSQLRRREVAAVKAAHDLKALTARLECAEQDKSSLVKRACAAGEEHRVERARWFVHKQELETRCVQLESRDTQYRASVRKKEVEYGKLQDNMRRAVQKDTRGGKGFHRGIELNFELSPGEATTEGGREPLGGVLNEKALKKVAGLEKENSSLRNMVVDLQADVVDLRGYHDRHRDLVSAERVSSDANGDGIWGEGGESEALAEEVIEGMPADWLQKRLGEETTRQIVGMRGALVRVLGDGKERSAGEDMSEADMMSLVSQLREARSLLREQDAIMLAAIFDRPGADTAVAINRHRCMCGADASGIGGSGMWDSVERLEQEREELERERSRLEKDKAKFLDEAVRRDNKSFVFRGPPGTPVSPSSAGIMGPGDVSLSTPRHFHRHLAGAGTLMVPISPCPAFSESGGLPLLTFSPPAASPDTARLLGQLGIEPGGGGGRGVGMGVGAPPGSFSPMVSMS